ncbi:MAG: hypothetical protein JWQ36_1076 [Enterovirga sp.]|jgi:hypothetical protein|nr:hypothetical protein [Enterovirga sp.]
MKRSRSTKEQIVAILREQEAGVATAEVCRKHRHQQRDLLRLEGEVWRLGCVAGPQAEGTVIGERQAQEAPGRGDARCRRFAGRDRKT